MGPTHRVQIRPQWVSSMVLGLGLVVGLGPVGSADPLPPATSRQIDYARDVQPILSKHCYRCHGPQRQKGGLSLHSKAKALAGGDGGPPFETGQSAESRLIELVAAVNEGEVMPPEGAGERLSPEEVGVLRAWIDQGAHWPDEAAAPTAMASDHWSFQKPVRGDLPPVKNPSWVRNPIDRFVLARMEQLGLSPAPQADRATLIRRLSLDLIGLPPSISEVDAFVADTRPDAYERLVERLLASPHYGERWGRRWLDRARYADTNGYEKDRERSIWPYRDWVIQAINTDLPFDRFTIEQIAGDLLPNATLDQKVATGFHRNTMINEEGGIDVEEFRFASLVDRVATTGAVWLGLTIQCAQCHTHKYDPITQREYYQFLSYFNNADEPELALPDGQVTERRHTIEAKIAALEGSREPYLATQPATPIWQVLQPSTLTASSGATLTAQPDGSIVVTGPVPETDQYTVVVDTTLTDLTAFRVEALADPSSRGRGPGRTPHGNFVLSEFQVTAAPRNGDSSASLVPLAVASTDFAQTGFQATAAIDHDPHTGWAIDDGSGRLNKNRWASFRTEGAVGSPTGTRLTFRLDQTYGGRHVLGRFRISAQTRPEGMTADPPSLEARMADWEKQFQPVRWVPLRPSRFESKKHATLTLKDDLSVLVTGDKPNNDTYEVEVDTDLKEVTALRVEVLPDPSLPEGGPGRAPLFSVGDFILTEFLVAAAPTEGKGPARSIPIQTASEDYSEPNRPAALAIDGKPDTGWTVRGGVGQPHAAVFELKEKVGSEGGTRFTLTLRQEGIHQMTIGRFRISATTDPGPVRASKLPPQIEAILLRAPADRNPTERSIVQSYYLSVAPELAKTNEKIAALRKALPRYPTTMIMQERLPEHARTTHIHKRGEFLKIGDPVEPGMPAVLPPLRPGESKNRLGLAHWLVSQENPLVTRVVMNQLWQAYFGRGLVATVDDFGTRGEKPTHPELLDWLATEFPQRGWSMKAMHRLIVNSATYRQDSRITSEGLARDPRNEWLSRGPRFRVEAEVIRDIALAASGLLNPKVGGPSVFPPQPDGVTSLAYGSVAWKTSQGAERYRRGLYTYAKRTAPYASFAIMDGPTSETVCVRRERSNTPLQALTLLNDTVFVEAARGLAQRVMDEAPDRIDERARHAFRLCLSRQPRPDEVDALVRFYGQQLDRFLRGEADPARVLGIDSDAAQAKPNLAERAAWTTVARALLNLDETISKE